MFFKLEQIFGFHKTTVFGILGILLILSIPIYYFFWSLNVNNYHIEKKSTVEICSKLIGDLGFYRSVYGTKEIRYKLDCKKEKIVPSYNYGLLFKKITEKFLKVFDELNGVDAIFVIDKNGFIPFTSNQKVISSCKFNVNLLQKITTNNTKKTFFDYADNYYSFNVIKNVKTGVWGYVVVVYSKQPVIAITHKFIGILVSFLFISGSLFIFLLSIFTNKSSVVFLKQDNF